MCWDWLSGRRGVLSWGNSGLSTQPQSDWLCFYLIYVSGFNCRSDLKNGYSTKKFSLRLENSSNAALFWQSLDSVFALTLLRCCLGVRLNFQSINLTILSFPLHQIPHWSLSNNKNNTCHIASITKSSCNLSMQSVIITWFSRLHSSIPNSIL